MKNPKNSLLISALAAWLLFPCAVMAQGSTPGWTNQDIRDMQYPAETYYTGFAQLSVAAGEGQEEAMNRAKQAALGELAERVRVMVNSQKTAMDTSISGNTIRERIRSHFMSTVKTTSQTEVVGSNLSTYYDSAKDEVYALAFVSKADLASYYRKQISLHLNKVDGALQTAGELVEKGYKGRARKTCKSLLDAFAMVVYAQDLLTAIDESGDDNALQQQRSEQLHNVLIQTLAGLENSIFVYVECVETVEEEEVTYIADKLPGLLTENGCGCSFTELEDDADFVIRVNAHFTRCTYAESGLVFCYVSATVSLYNARTRITLKPNINEAKGGWTNRNHEKAIAVAFDELVQKIAEKTIPMMKD
jgi:hypothetical protein